jgi:3-oxoacyl-[acyl-carrier protein] reductase
MDNGAPVMLITGSRKGIGRYLVQYYLEKGFKVEGCSRGAAKEGLDGYHHHQLDVCDEASVKQMFSSIRKRHRRLDVTINNAGIAGMNHTLLTPHDAAERIMRTNFLGTFLICRESAKLMKKRKSGRIVNFSTIAVPMSLEGEAVYASSKSAIETFSKVIAKEFAEFGITCNVIGPSPIETDLIKAVPAKKIEALVNRLGLKKLGDFDDVSNVIDFYIKPQSHNISGQVIYLGGIS